MDNSGRGAIPYDVGIITSLTFFAPLAVFALLAVPAILHGHEQSEPMHSCRANIRTEVRDPSDRMGGQAVQVFKFAKEGDLLIIKPARAEDWRAKRILKLIVNGC